MGAVADEAIRARARRRTDDLAKLASTNAATGPKVQLAERRRRLAVSEVRRALRTQRLAQEAVALADERAAAFIRILADQGFTQSRIAATFGVPLWTVRRLLALTRPAHRAANVGDDLG